MSDYCTNCIHLSKLNFTSCTGWRCTHDRFAGYVLQSLCGNPTKLAKCKGNNWFKSKEKQMTTQEKIVIMQAYLDGKQMQIKKPLSEDWSDWDNNGEPYWNWNAVEYRIKPEPKYRPYNAEEMKALVGKQLTYKEFTAIVAAYNSTNNRIRLDIYGWCSESWLLDMCKMLDGSPCGVLEE